MGDKHSSPSGVAEGLGHAGQVKHAYDAGVKAMRGIEF